MAVHDLLVEVGDVALQTGQLPGPLPGGFVQFLRLAADLEEPDPAERCLAGGDLLGLGDHRVDVLVVPLGAREPPLVDDPPVAGVLARAHLPV